MVEIPACSAMAVDSEWILTAEHCTPGLTPGSSTATLYYPSETRTIREILHRTSANEDIALLRVHPFGSTDIKPIQLWNANLSGVINQTLTCAGRGYNTYTTGFGPWRSAELSPWTVNGNGYLIQPNGSGQIMWSGDSGGPCLINSGGAWKLTGVTSGASSNGSQVTSAYQIGLNTLLSGLVDDFRQRSRMFFYTASGGNAFAPALERNGTFTTNTLMSGFSTWHQVVVLRNGAILFYNSANGSAAAGRINKDGTYTATAANLPSLATGYTHAISVGPDRAFLYNASTGIGRGVRLDALGSAAYGSAITLGSGWGNFAGTKDGELFFSQPAVPNVYATGVIGKLDSSLNFTQQQVFDLGIWEKVVAVNDRGLLFYNPSTGAGRTAQILSIGLFQEFGNVSGLGTGYGLVVGSANGDVLFVNGSGSGYIARISASGGATFHANVTGIATGYIVSAE